MGNTTHTSAEQSKELPAMEAVMEQAQVFASAWAMYGSGSAFEPENSAEVAQAEKSLLESMVRRLHASVQELKASQARVPLPEAIPQSDTLWAFLTKGMTLSAIALLSNEHDKKVYLDRAAKNWAVIRSECITQEKQG